MKKKKKLGKLKLYYKHDILLRALFYKTHIQQWERVSTTMILALIKYTPELHEEYYNKMAVNKKDYTGVELFDFPDRVSKSLKTLDKYGYAKQVFDRNEIYYNWKITQKGYDYLKSKYANAVALTSSSDLERKIAEKLFKDCAELTNSL
jgi:hypothetical protein